MSGVSVQPYREAQRSERLLGRAQWSEPFEQTQWPEQALEPVQKQALAVQRQRRWRYQGQGFTLVELLVVLVIMGVSMSLVGPLVVRQVDRIKVIRERETLYRILEQIELESFVYRRTHHLTLSENRIQVHTSPVWAGVAPFDAVPTSASSGLVSPASTSVFPSASAASSTPASASSSASSSASATVSANLSASTAPQSASSRSSDDLVRREWQFEGLHFPAQQLTVNGHGFWQQTTLTWQEGERTEQRQLRQGSAQNRAISAGETENPTKADDSAQRAQSAQSAQSAQLAKSAQLAQSAQSAQLVQNAQSAKGEKRAKRAKNAEGENG